MFKRDRTGRARRPCQTAAGRVPKPCSGCDSYILVAIEGENEEVEFKKASANHTFMFRS